MARKAHGGKPDKRSKRKSSNVPGTYLGFSLQTTRFLEHMLKAAPGDVVCLEVFEDVGVEKADGSRIAEQSKSNLAHNPLADRAIDFWKTLRNWLDAVEIGDLDPERTAFILYASNPAGGPIAQSFHDAKTHNVALEALKNAKERLLDKDHDGGGCSIPGQFGVHLRRIFSADEATVAKIIVRFTFESGCGSSYEELRSLTKWKLVSEDVCEEVIQWALGWIKKATDQLMEKGKPARIEQGVFHNALLRYVQTHDRINILRSVAGTFSRETLQKEADFRVYVRQLNLIQVDTDDILAAVNDFMCAASDRTHWSERGLINESSLDEYSNELCRSWSNKKIKVTTVHSQMTNIDQGRVLYSECMEHSLPLDGLETPTYFSRGSWHALSDDQIVGWHPDYKTELQRDAGGDVSMPEEGS